MGAGILDFPGFGGYAGQSAVKAPFRKARRCDVRRLSRVFPRCFPIFSNQQKKISVNRRQR